MKSLWRASFLVVLSAPVVAWAQSSTTPSTSPSSPSSSSTPSTSPSTSSSSSIPSFDSLDTNHDGVLSRDEYAAMAHGGASNKDAGNGNYHTSNPHPYNNGQSQSQNQTPSQNQTESQNQSQSQN